MVFQFDSAAEHFIEVITDYVSFNLTINETEFFGLLRKRISQSDNNSTLKWFSQQNSCLIGSDLVSPPTISSHCFFLLSGTVKNIRPGTLVLTALHDGTMHVFGLSGGIF